MSSISSILYSIQSHLYYYLIISTHSEVKILEKQRDAVIIDKEESVTNYYRIRQQLAKLDSQIQVTFIIMYIQFRIYTCTCTCTLIHTCASLREFWPTPLTSQFEHNF